MAYPAIRSSNSGTAGDATGYHTIVLPATIEAGDTLLWFLGCDADEVTGVEASWTGGKETSDSARSFAWGWKKAAGNEDGTTVSVAATTDNSEPAYFTVYAISGAADPTVISPTAGTASPGTSNAPSPPTLSSLTAKDYLVFVAEGNDHNDTLSSYPSGYDLGQLDSRGTGNGDAGVASAAAQVNATSVDPGNFGLSGSEEWAAQTIAIHPAATASVSATAITTAATFGALVKKVNAATINNPVTLPTGFSTKCGAGPATINRAVVFPTAAVGIKFTPDPIDATTLIETPADITIGAGPSTVNSPTDLIRPAVRSGLPISAAAIARSVLVSTAEVGIDLTATSIERSVDFGSFAVNCGSRVTPNPIGLGSPLAAAIPTANVGGGATGQTIDLTVETPTPNVGAGTTIEPVLNPADLPTTFVVKYGAKSEPATIDNPVAIPTTFVLGLGERVALEAGISLSALVPETFEAHGGGRVAFEAVAPLPVYVETDFAIKYGARVAATPAECATSFPTHSISAHKTITFETGITTLITTIPAVSTQIPGTAEPVTITVSTFICDPVTEEWATIYAATINSIAAIPYPQISGAQQNGQAAPDTISLVVVISSAEVGGGTTASSIDTSVTITTPTFQYGGSITPLAITLLVVVVYELGLGAGVGPAPVSGVTVIDGFTLNYGSSIECGTVNVVTAVPTPAASGAGSISPATINIVTAISEATPTGGGRVDSTSIACVVTFSTIARLGEGAGITAATITCPAAVSAATTQWGTSVAAAAVELVVTIQPVARLGLGEQVTATTVDLIASLPAPTIQYGGRVDPATIALLAVVSTVSRLGAGETITVQTVEATTAISETTIKYGGRIDPASIDMLVVFSAAEAYADLLVTPGSILAPVAISEATLYYGYSFTPLSITLLTEVYAVTTGAGAGVVATPVAGETTVTGPTLQYGGSITATTVTNNTLVPTINVGAGTTATTIQAVTAFGELAIQYSAQITASTITATTDIHLPYVVTQRRLDIHQAHDWGTRYSTTSGPTTILTCEGLHSGDKYLVLYRINLSGNNVSACTYEAWAVNPDGTSTLLGKVNPPSATNANTFAAMWVGDSTGTDPQIQIAETGTFTTYAADASIMTIELDAEQGTVGSLAENGHYWYAEDDNYGVHTAGTWNATVSKTLTPRSGDDLLIIGYAVEEVNNTTHQADYRLAKDGNLLGAYISKEGKHTDGVWGRLLMAVDTNVSETSSVYSVECQDETGTVTPNNTAKSSIFILRLDTFENHVALTGSNLTPTADTWNSIVDAGTYQPTSAGEQAIFGYVGADLNSTLYSAGMRLWVGDIAQPGTPYYPGTVANDATDIVPKPVFYAHPIAPDGETIQIQGNPSNDSVDFVDGMLVVFSARMNVDHGSVSATPIACPASVSAATAQTGSGVTAITVELVGLVSTATIKYGCSVAASTINTVVSVSGTTLQYSARVEPSTISVLANIYSAAPNASSQITLSPIENPVEINGVTLRLGGGVNATAIQMFALIVAPESVNADKRVDAATVTLATYVSGATVRYGASISVNTVNVTVLISGATFGLGAGIAATDIYSVVRFGTPAVFYGANFTPATIECAALVSLPETTGNGSVEPAAINLTALVSPVETRAGETLNPSTINVVIAIQGVTLYYGASIAPLAITMLAEVYAVTLGLGTGVGPDPVNSQVIITGHTLQYGGSLDLVAISTSTSIPSVNVGVGTAANTVNATVSLSGITLRYGGSPTVAPVTATVVISAGGITGNGRVDTSAISLTTLIPAPTVQYGGAVIATAINAVTSIPTHTVTIYLTVTPGTVSATVTVQEATTQYGTSVAPLAITMLGEVYSVTIGASSLVGPNPTDTTAVVPYPTVQYGGLVAATTIASNALVPTVADVLCGAGPDAIIAPVALPAPEVTIYLTVLPNTISVFANIQEATTRRGATVTPIAITMLAGVYAVTLGASWTIGPSSVITVVSTPSPTFRYNAQITLSSVSTQAAITSVKVGAGTGPHPLNTTVVLPVPVVFNSNTAYPTTVSLPVTIPRPHLGTVVSAQPLALEASLTTPTFQLSKFVYPDSITVAVNLGSLAVTGTGRVVPNSLPCTAELPQANVIIRIPPDVLQFAAHITRAVSYPAEIQQTVRGQLHVSQAKPRQTYVESRVTETAYINRTSNIVEDA